MLNNQSYSKIHIFNAALIFLLIIIPASSFFPLRISISLILLVEAIYFSLAKNKINKKILAFSLLTFFIIIFNYANSYLAYPIFLQSNTEALLRYLSFFSALISLMILFELNIISIKSCFKSMLYALIFYNSLKILLMLTVPLGIFSARELSEFVESFGIRVVDGFWSEDASFNRLVFGNDILTPFLLLFILKINNNFKFIGRALEQTLIIITLVSALFTLTRYIWACEILVIVYYFLFLEKSRIIPLTALTLIVGFFIHLYAVNPILFESLTIRLFDTPSINMKAIQAEYLLDSFLNNIFFGCGQGCYSLDFIRSENLKFIYEVQIYALLMQFGIIGVGVFSTFFIWMVTQDNIFSRKKIFIYFFFFIWIASGFSNPYLFIQTSVFIYFLFYILSKIQDYRYTGNNYD